MSASPSRAPPGLGPPPGLGAGTSNSASRTSSHTSNSSGSPSRGRPSRWTAGTGQPNDNVSVAADGSVVLDGVSPAEEESAANVGASPSLGGRTGLTELMEAIEDIDAAIEGSDNENKDGDAGEDGAGGDDVPDDDFLNPTNCFICTEPIQFHALGSCNHRVCHVCSLRLRALYKHRSCAYCKRELDRVYFTRSSDRPFRSFTKRELPFEDRRLAIKFEDKDMFEDTMVLLRFNCPEPTCDVACPGGWKELRKHVRETHGMNLCDICTRHKKIFAHEHQLFTSSGLQAHYRGQDPVEPSFKGHPECGFCRSRFYGDDELWEHCRDRHEECFICVRKGIRHRYYLDYEKLSDHFDSEHFACKKPECLERKFVVFDNEIELKAHEVEVHGGGKKSRKVEIEVPFRRSTPGLEGGRAGGPERRPSPAPAQPTQPARDAFPALAAAAAPAPAAQSEEREGRRLRPPPGFGSQLTQTAAAGASGATAAANNTEIPSALQSIFDNDPRKYTEFRSLAQAYKGNLVTANEFVRSMVALATSGLTDSRRIKEKEAEVGKVWTRMAETAPEGIQRSGLGRREEMLRAWKDYKVSTSDFPGLPTPSPAAPAAPSTSYSNTANPRVITSNSSAASDRARVLVIKSNARKTVAAVPSQPRRSVYDKIAEEAIKRSASRDERSEQEREERELLQRAAEGTAPEARIKTLSRDEFEEQKAALAGRASSSSSSSAGGPSSWRMSTNKATEFPSLPTVAKPIKMARSGSNSGSNTAWGSGNGDQDDQGSGQDEGKKGKKNKKQVLLKIGL